MGTVEDRVAHVAELRDKAKELNLLGWESLFWSVALSDISARYNGCGPEWMGADLRRRLTQRLAIYEPAFLIHDNDFHCSDGTRESFDAANDRLEHNCLTVANATYPYDGEQLPRLKARNEALLIGEACRHLAWAAWRECHERIIEKTKI